MSPAIRRRRLLAALGAVVVAAVVVVAAIGLLGGGNGGAATPPATGAARLVPADALAYVHVSADRSRRGTRDALELLRPFPFAAKLWRQIKGQLTAGRTAFSFDRDVQPWLGDDAALALTAGETDVAGSLILVQVRDRVRATTFMERNTGARTSSTYRGVKITAFRNTAMAFIDHYLVIGQVDTLHAAIDVARGHAVSLARSATYRRATRDLDPGRFADAYVSRDGVRRLLAPQSGVLGIAGALLDKPTLVAASLSLTATGPGARIVTHSVLDPRLVPAAQRRPTGRFAPKLLDDVPADAMAYLGTRHLDRSSGLLLGLIGDTAAGPALQELLSGAGTKLLDQAGSGLAKSVLPIFRGEAAVWLTAGVPTPTLGVIAPVSDEAATAAALEGLHAPLATLLTPKGGSAPAFRSSTLGDTTVWSVQIGPGADLFYAVFDHKLVIATRLSGIRAVRDHKGSLADAPSFEATLGDRPATVSSLVFLDLGKLLRLGEQTGLAKNDSYLAVRPDLRQIEALGAAASGGETDSTSELTLQIP